MEDPDDVRYVNYLESLPPEVGCEILKTLSPRTLGEVSRVSSVLRGLVNLCISRIVKSIRAGDLVKFPGSRMVDGWVLLVGGSEGGRVLLQPTVDLLAAISQRVAGSLKIRGVPGVAIVDLLRVRSHLYPEAEFRYERKGRGKNR